MRLHKTSRSISWYQVKKSAILRFETGWFFDKVCFGRSNLFWLFNDLPLSPPQRTYFLNNPFVKFQTIFKSTNEEMLLMQIFHAALWKGSSNKMFNWRAYWLFEKKGNVYVVLGFACSRNEICLTEICSEAATRAVL